MSILLWTNTAMDVSPRNSMRYHTPAQKTDPMIGQTGLWELKDTRNFPTDGSIWLADTDLMREKETDK